MKIDERTAITMPSTTAMLVVSSVPYTSGQAVT
jgi:hypothetical protein